MKRTDSAASLKQSIAMLEASQSLQLQELKDQFQLVYDSVRPSSFIKNTLNELGSSSEVKSSLVKNALALSTGFLSKKILLGTPHNPVTRILGSLLQYTIAHFVSKKITVAGKDDDRERINLKLEQYGN